MTGSLRCRRWKGNGVVDGYVSSLRDSRDASECLSSGSALWPVAAGVSYLTAVAVVDFLLFFQYR